MKKNVMKAIWITCVLCVAAGMLGAAPGAAVAGKITIINKTGYAVGVEFTAGNDSSEQYYFSIPLGSKERPVERTFSIPSQEYTVTVYYRQVYDPVYGYACNSNPSTRVGAESNQRMVLTPCDGAGRRTREPSLYRL